MIQRIQSMFLLLVVVLSVLMMSGTIYRFSDPSYGSIHVTFMGAYADIDGTSTGRDIFILIFSILVPVIAAATIFLFKTRKLQWKVAGITVLIDAVLVVLLLIHVLPRGGEGFGSPQPSYRCVIPIVNFILLLLAIRGIRKDDELVKSYDRIR